MFADMMKERSHRPYKFDGAMRDFIREKMERSQWSPQQIKSYYDTYIKPGMSTRDIDNFVESNIVKAKMEPAFKGLYDFPASACISVNEQLVHGIPSKKVILNEGDIVSVDTGTIYKGYNSDAARTYGVGSIDGEAQRLIDVTRESFFKGLEFCREGYRLFDVSSTICTES